MVSPQRTPETGTAHERQRVRSLSRGRPESDRSAARANIDPMAERATPPPGVQERLRALPSVDRLATAVARAELAERRAELLAGAPAR